MRGLAAALAACCMLAACSDAPPPDTATACGIEKTAEIPLALERGYIAIPAAIEGKPVSMLVDTGAERTAVTPDAVEVLRLQGAPHAVAQIIGTGGTLSTSIVHVQSLSIGGIETLNQAMPVAALPHMSMMDFQASGDLGVDWLHDYDVDLDLPHHRMALYTAQGCATATPPWTGGASAIPADFHERGIITIPVTLDGTALRAVLVSGADRTTVPESVAATLGVDAAALAHDRGGRGIGTDGTVHVTHQHVFAELTVGGVTDLKPRLTVGTPRLPYAATMLLGLDWLREHRVWIAYANSKLFVATGQRP